MSSGRHVRAEGGQSHRCDGGLLGHRPAVRLRERGVCRVVRSCPPRRCGAARAPSCWGRSTKAAFPRSIRVLDGERQQLECEVAGARGIRHALIDITPDVVAGAVVGFAMHLTDVTTLRRARGRALMHSAALLREGDERLQLALTATGGAHWDWDVLAGRSLRQPALVQHPAGYPPGDAVQGIDFVRSRVHPDDIARVVEASSSAFARKVPYMVEARMRRADGSFRWIQSHGSVTASGPTGAPARITGINTDVHERKVAEKATARLELQLQQAQKMESVGRLAGGVAHDSNNMISVILAYTDVALRDVDPASRLHTDLLEIRKAAERSAALTRQLLAFARRQVVAPTVVDPNASIGQTVAMLQRLIGENIRISWEPCERPWSILVDPSQLDQLLANLCVNARDAIAGVGTIVIKTSNWVATPAFCEEHADAPPGEYVRLTVRDDGHGMTPETVAQIFEPFFTTKPPDVGTGLGLATVYGVVKQNGGFITVESEPGKGTSFHVHFPRRGGCRHSGGLARGCPERCDGRWDGDHPHRGGRAGDLAHPHARAGAAGLQGPRDEQPRGGPPRSRGEKVRLVLTDVVMPEMNGRELASALRARHLGLKLLFMSGYPSDVIGSGGFVGEGVRFIEKPFPMPEVVRKVRELLDEKE